MNAQHCATLVASGAVALCIGGCQFAGAYKGYTAEPIDVSRADTIYDRVVAAVVVRTPPIKACFADAYRPGNADAELCTGLRNETISYLMSESVQLCAVHLSGIYGKEAGFNIATGSIASFASGLASITIGTQAKTLSALSTFASAERSLVNESVYKNLLTTAIGTKIEQSRATLGKALLARTTQSYKEYGVGRAIQDVIEYHDACSFYKGMQIALAEGTNTNPASKLASLKTEASSLAQQIDTRAVALKMDESSRKALLDTKGAATTGDPVLKGLVDQLLNVQHEIQTLTQDPAPAVKPAAGGSAIGGDAGTSRLDLKLEDPGNPLLALASVYGKLKSQAEPIAGSVKQAAGDKLAASSEYLKAVASAVTGFADAFKNDLLASGKPGDPEKGNIASKLRAYLDAQKEYVVKTSTLDLKNNLKDQGDEVDARAIVVKASLAVSAIQKQVAACEKTASARLQKFADDQTSFVKLKSANELAGVKTPQGDALNWKASTSADCPT